MNLLYHQLIPLSIRSFKPNSFKLSISITCKQDARAQGNRTMKAYVSSIRWSAIFQNINVILIMMENRYNRKF
uniref:Uncharacterized protein n=1 Tax=Anopheles dirus TaxID=7168 RepID=A0A182NW76_9DIPT